MHSKEAGKKESSAVFACDGNFAVGVAITIMALEKLSPGLFSNYVIFCDNWSPEDLGAVRLICNRVVFIENTREDFLKRNAGLINKPMLAFMDRRGHYKYIFSDIFKLLSEYKKIVFMDADLVILSDISAIMAHDSIAWRAGWVRTEYKGTQLDRPNAGIIVFNDTIPYERLAVDYLDYCKEADGWDEIALARLAHDHKIKTNLLDHRFNVTTGTVHILKFTNIAVFHCVGINKIWNSDRYDAMFPEYIEYINDYSRIKGVASDKALGRDKSVREQIYLKNNICTLESMKMYIPSYIDIRYTSLLENKVRLRVKGQFKAGIHYSFNHNDDESIRMRLSVADPVKSKAISAGLEKSNAPYKCNIAPDGSGTFYTDIKVTKISKVADMFSFFEPYVVAKQSPAGAKV